MPTELFSPASRKVLRDLFFPPNEMLVCEHGFLDHEEGIPVTDEAMLKILHRRFESAKKAVHLSDKAEAYLNDMLGKLGSMGGILPVDFTHGRGADLWVELKNAREAAGRPDPSRKRNSVGDAGVVERFL